MQKKKLKNIVFLFILFSFVKLKLDKERDLQLGVKGFHGHYHFQGEFSLNGIKFGTSDHTTLDFNYYKLEGQFLFNHKELENDVKIQFDQLKGKNEYSYKIITNGKSLKESKFNNFIETIQLKAEKIKKYCNNFLEICEIIIKVSIEDRKKTESRLKITVTSIVKEDDESDKPSEKNIDESDKTSGQNEEESDKSSDKIDDESDKIIDQNEEESDKPSDKTDEEESDKSSDKTDEESDKPSDKNEEESDKSSDKNEEESDKSSDKTDEESDKTTDQNEEESDEGSVGNQDRKEEKNENNKPNDGNDNAQNNRKAINGGDGDGNGDDDDDGNKALIVVFSILGVVIVIAIAIGLYYYYFKIHPKNKRLNDSINEISFKDDDRYNDDDDIRDSLTD